MEETKSPKARPVVQEETVRIPQDHNRLLVRARDHTWISVSTKENEELAREGIPNPITGFSLPPGTYLIRTDGKIENVTSEALEPTPSLLERLQQAPALLRLTTDAPDRHVVDGISEIPADGTSFCAITVEKVAFGGTSLTGSEHKDELFLRTTGGVLMDAKGQNRIRFLELRSGRARFRLVSEKHPKAVTVSVFGREPFFSKAEIHIEFV